MNQEEIQARRAVLQARNEELMQEREVLEGELAACREEIKNQPKKPRKPRVSSNGDVEETSHSEEMASEDADGEPSNDDIV